MKTRHIILITILSIIGMSAITNYTIIGLVQDAEGFPLIGANIFEKGTTNGTVTDIDGNFSLVTTLEEPELEISYTGYQRKKVKAKAGEKQIITLHEGQFMDEVLVTSSRRTKENTRKDKKVFASKLQSESKQSGIIPNQNTSVISLQSSEQENWNTEDYSTIQENRFHSPNDEPLSTFSIDVDRASYSNVRRFLNNGSLPPIDAVRIEEMINYFDYEYPQPRSKTPFAVHNTLTDCPWNSDHQILHIGVQGRKVATQDLPPSNLVFLVDVSGSMNSPNKLGLLKASFNLLVENLRDIDRVSIVVYAGNAGLVLPPTRGTDQKIILEALDNLRAGGSTAGGAGIELAYKVAKENFVKEGNNRVILATDGDFNVGASSDSEMVRLIEEKREDGIFLSVLGFGMGNYKDNKMQELADNGNGNHAYIDNLQEARKVFVHEFGGTLFTIAKDVKIQIEFNPDQVSAYRLIGYENRILNKEDFNDDTKDAGELGSGHVVTAMYEIIPAGTTSEYLSSVDDLKYQKSKMKKNHSKELATIKLRYKMPDGKKSKKIEISIPQKPNDTISTDVEFAMCVAEFGLLLRNSDYKKDSHYDQILERARSSKGSDKHGYRAEFINMVRNARDLDKNDLAKK